MRHPTIRKMIFAFCTVSVPNAFFKVVLSSPNQMVDSEPFHGMIVNIIIRGLLSVWR